jgi:hypothetical protein
LSSFLACLFLGDNFFGMSTVGSPACSSDNKAGLWIVRLLVRRGSAAGAVSFLDLPFF